MSTWNGTYEGEPDGGDSPSTIDNVIRDTRESVQKRMANEHDTYVADSTAGAESKDWVHKEGSAMAYYESAAPTNQPNGETLAARDAGRLWVDSDDNRASVWNGTSFEEIISGGILEAGGAVLKTKVLNIGDWNMDSTIEVEVTHNVTDYTKIRTVFALIRPDTGAVGNVHYPLTWDAGSGADGRINGINATKIKLARLGGGLFDTVSFNATSYNRGWVTIQYED